MGLDNGIMLKIKDAKKFGSDRLPIWIPRQDWEDANNYDWELMYWRKCWNIRNVIFRHLVANDIDTCDDCSFKMPMPLEVLWGLCEKLDKCYTEKWWTENDDSIWAWEDIEESGFYTSRLALTKRLIGWLEDKDPDSYEIYFYDSY